MKNAHYLQSKIANVPERADLGLKTMCAQRYAYKIWERIVKMQASDLITEYLRVVERLGKFRGSDEWDKNLEKLWEVLWWQKYGGSVEYTYYAEIKRLLH